jgi:outer membrane lipoprotein-sorting protein
MTKYFLLFVTLQNFSKVHAQADSVLNKVKQKLQQVKDYQADALMKLNVPFLQVPDSKVTVYFKQPDKFRIVQEKGVAIVPRGGVGVNLPSLLEGKDYISVDAGTTSIGSQKFAVIKMLPKNEEGDVILSTLYIDTKSQLVKRITNSTKENGTYTIDFSYGKYSSWALPDELTFSFDTKDYKLPKGMTFDYDEDVKPDTTKTRNGRGEVKIIFNSYTINKGVSDAYFQQKR